MIVNIRPTKPRPAIKPVPTKPIKLARCSGCGAPRKTRMCSYCGRMGD